MPQLPSPSQEEDDDYNNDKPKPNTTSPNKDMFMILTALLPMFVALLFLGCLPHLLGQESGGLILNKALTKAFRGGIPGSAAAAVQILSLMWLRTIVNYQYKTGKSFSNSFHTLLNEGGARRFYRGFLPAILLVPLSRFGDTAANAGVFALLSTSPAIPVLAKTALASLASSLWRILLMPLVVLKTTLQVSGKDGLAHLRTKITKYGTWEVWFRGTAATVVAQFMGHYPWFLVHNSLEDWIAMDCFGTTLASGLVRAALIGIGASMVSDALTNSIKVVNTFRQTSEEHLSYTETVQRVIQEGGVVSLFTRGLGAKMLVNCLNSIVFKVLLQLW
jgi:hypothetical protein